MAKKSCLMRKRETTLRNSYFHIIGTKTRQNFQRQWTRIFPTILTAFLWPTVNISTPRPISDAWYWTPQNVFSHPTILCTKFLIKYQNLQKVLWNKEIWYVVLFCHPHIKCIITLIINHVLVTVGITHDSVLPSQSSSAVFCAQKYFTIKTKRETDKIEDREATLYRYIF